jgi:hypothetical protein
MSTKDKKSSLSKQFQKQLHDLVRNRLCFRHSACSVFVGAASYR